MCGFKRPALSASQPLSVATDISAIDNRFDQLQGIALSSAYAKQKTSLKKEFSAFLGSLPGNKTLFSATPKDVCRFLAWKDSRGKTQVHVTACPYLGKHQLHSCGCPVRLSCATVDSYIGKLTAIFKEAGREGDWNSALGLGNPAASAEVKAYLKAISFPESASISFQSPSFPTAEGIWDKAFTEKQESCDRSISAGVSYSHIRFDKMEAVFHEGIKYSLEKLGHPERKLKKEQYEAIRAIFVEKKDVLAVLPTGFGKSLIYQVIPSVFDFLRSGREPEKEDSGVIVVSPLNALMRDQVRKLEEFLTVCVLQSIVEDEGGHKVAVPKDLKKCSLVFGHPEVFVDCRNVAKVLKEKDLQERVQAIVIDEAHNSTMVIIWFFPHSPSD